MILPKASKLSQCWGIYGSKQEYAKHFYKQSLLQIQVLNTFLLQGDQGLDGGFGKKQYFQVERRFKSDCRCSAFTQLRGTATAICVG